MAGVTFGLLGNLGHIFGVPFSMGLMLSLNNCTDFFRDGTLTATDFRGLTTVDVVKLNLLGISGTSVILNGFDAGGALVTGADFFAVMVGRLTTGAIFGLILWTNGAGITFRTSDDATFVTFLVNGLLPVAGRPMVAAGATIFFTFAVSAFFSSRADSAFRRFFRLGVGNCDGDNSASFLDRVLIGEPRSFRDLREAGVCKIGIAPTTFFGSIFFGTIGAVDAVAVWVDFTVT